MSWMLPTRCPVFWEEMRRRIVARWSSFALLLGIVLLGGAWFGGLACLSAARHGFDPEYWPLLLRIQGVLVLLLAPGLAVGTFARERERGSLDFLFLTPLSTAALVVQRFGGACVPLLALLLAVLPLDLLIAVAGQVPAPSSIAEYLLLLVRGMTFVAIALMVSCLTRTTRSATLTTYTGLFILEYAVGWLLAAQLLPFLAARYPSPLTALLLGPAQAYCAGACYLVLLAGSLGVCIATLARQRRPLATELAQSRQHLSRGHASRPLPDRRPVLWDDLRRRLRGRRTYAVLLGYVLALCAILTVLFLNLLHSDRYALTIDPQSWAVWGETLFRYAIIGQGLLVAVISPGLTATLFSTERETRRMDFLLLSRLTTRELIIDKYLAAVGMILLTLFCGTPVIAIIAATFGGVPPLELLLWYAAILLAGLFCAATSLLYSLKAKNSSAALVQGYVVSWLGLLAVAALTPLCFIGPPLAVIEIIRNLNHAAKRLEDWRRQKEDDPYALPLMQGYEDAER